MDVADLGGDLRHGQRRSVKPLHTYSKTDLSGYSCIFVLLFLEAFILELDRLVTEFREMSDAQKMDTSSSLKTTARADGWTV